MTDLQEGPILKQIKLKLMHELTPSALIITDDSDKHKGHLGAREGGETHFSAHIISHAFDELSLLARQRLVYRILHEEMKETIHALSLKCQSPSEVKT